MSPQTIEKIVSAYFANIAAMNPEGWVSKTGKPVIFAGITIFEINSAGKIQTTRAYWNPQEMVAQLR
ncbi:hypothetical protein NWP22_08285 [Anabaenopsis tanganyikae CS-531]|uniref:Ketosteroid isomerase n=1 Tax=Anabaenopsis tanganyikae CS-531 TaxID=2785304 RepID=A0ABT6KEJ5_9CYAN|nr:MULTISPECIES: hypothetical protein [Anabaenopsis]MDH6098408.1 hypothetical protein [Anabaenopsis sp. FSS-46]MDH6105861.1 hypothetical protein [Anabaenopsis tanganyikae CS-531]